MANSLAVNHGELPLLIWSSFNPFSRHSCREKTRNREKILSQKLFLSLCVDCNLSFKLNISSLWSLNPILMNNSDRSHDLNFLFDKEKSLRSFLSIVFILEFPNYKSKRKVLLAFRLVFFKCKHSNVPMN